MIRIERIVENTIEIVDGLNNLLPQLGADYSINSSLLQNIIDSEDTYLLIAKEDTKIVGTLTLVLYMIPTGLRSWIEDVVVDKDSRGKGIARKLMNEAIGIAKEREVQSLSLSSRAERIEANKLYRSLGFDIRKTNFYRYNNLDK